MPWHNVVDQRHAALYLRKYFFGKHGLNRHSHESAGIQMIDQWIPAFAGMTASLFDPRFPSNGRVNSLQNSCHVPLPRIRTAHVIF